MLQKFKLKIDTHSANAGYYMAFKHHISFGTDLTANFGCNRIRITPDIVSKLLRAAIWSRCAVRRFESEQTPGLTPFSRIGRRFRSAALHRIWFRTYCFVPIFIFLNRNKYIAGHWTSKVQHVCMISLSLHGVVYISKLPIAKTVRNLRNLRRYFANIFRTFP